MWDRGGEASWLLCLWAGYSLRWREVPDELRTWYKDKEVTGSGREGACTGGPVLGKVWGRVGAGIGPEGGAPCLELGLRAAGQV